MRAMVLHEIGQPLVLEDVPKPEGEILLRVSVCGVCRTDLHIVDGELPMPKLPLIPGHQIVGYTEEGKRMGVPWLHKTCGKCKFCISGRENLCDHAQFTGYSLNGGYAEYVVADPDFCFPLPGEMSDVAIAPLLCAGMIGYRAYKLSGKGSPIGLYGFGSAAHIVAQLALYEGKEVYAFTRGDHEFAESIGCQWVGKSGEKPPKKLESAIIFAPVGALYPEALKVSEKGATIVSAGIHMSDIPSFPYRDLWEERVMRSVANLTRQDGKEFFSLAAKAKIKTTVNEYKLEEANQALDDLREGRFKGAAVLRV